VADLAPLPLDRWLRHDELRALLERWAEQRPDLLELESIGRSHEGRHIWLCTVTERASGPAAEKPAIWIDANLHATEVTGSAAALHLIHHLLAGADEPRIARALRTRAFYIAPRLNPDGAELALADRPQLLRSGVRPWPLPDPQPGLHESDVDGDGRMLSMRIPDPTGLWKTHPDEPRLLVPREPDEEEGGPFYRLLHEGHLVDYDGDIIKVAPALAGLDFNRNYPYDWRPAQEQEGAGPYPTSEPEVRAHVQAVVERPNITHVVAYHTFSAVHLRPFGGRPDDEMPPADLAVYEQIGRAATRITGYPSVSVFHHFLYEPKQYMRGAFDEWAYDHFGVFGWTTEFWSPMRAAGVDIGLRFIEWWKDHPIEDDLAMLRWSDAQGGVAFVDWYPFDHPQLGPVELGGWDWMHALSNPPLHLLEAEIAPHADLAIYLALISPRLELRSLEVERLGSGVARVRLVVQNAGWLPTNVSDKALERKASRPVEALIDLPEGARLASGTARVELGQLTGRPRSPSTLGWYAGGEPSSERARCEWVVEGAPGATLRVTARHPRAGTCRASLALPA
jgi:hypothetical protein